MQPTRRDFLAAASAASLTAAQNTAARPNILFIMPDQWRAQDLGYMGNEQIRTPHLDRLAAESVVLKNAVANTPVCCPCRSTLMTGKYPHQNNVAVNDLPLAESERTIAEVLQDAGYYTGFIGKWHLAGLPRMPGFVPPGPKRQGFEFWAANVCNHNYVKQSYFRDDPTPIAVAGYDTPTWTDLGIEFLTKAKQRPNQPFFLSLWYPAPHDPYIIPEGYEGMYSEDRLRQRPNWKPTQRAGTKKDLVGYYSAISCLDDQIGRLLKKLDELGMRENTVVIFASDHGDMHGSHGALLKRKPWEESCRVPATFRWPSKFGKPRMSDAPFSLIDLPPTILSLAGLRAPSQMEGQDYAGYLQGKTTKTPDHAIMQIYTKAESGEFAPWRGIRTRKWKYARFAEQRWMLHDLEKDPFEMTNLAEDRSHKALMDQFDKIINDYMRRTADKWDEQFDVLRPKAGAAPA